MGTEKINKLYGLVGKNISYSFSRGYFKEKFEALGLKNHAYINFDIQNIDELSQVVEKHKALLKGFNVTIPYKEKVMQFVHKLDDKAAEIGAVNTVKITKEGILEGYNTDCFGFSQSITPYLQKKHRRALILGTGGASRAVAYALKSLDILPTFVSRKPSETIIGYKDLNENLLNENLIIINCTPLGTYPNIAQAPDIPYEFIGRSHILYDLIYNPVKTKFLEKGERNGAQIKNGLEMLQLQAEKAWEIWK